VVPYNEQVPEMLTWVVPRRWAIVLCSPQTPAGQAYTRDEVRSLPLLAREHGIQLLADQACSDFLLGQAFCG
jgi:bifunctional pyridoxal-dependent enzyme with beta-cystathionase and maltose regulon repressor activities